MSSGNYVVDYYGQGPREGLPAPTEYVVRFYGDFMAARQTQESAETYVQAMVREGVGSETEFTITAEEIPPWRRCQDYSAT